MENTYWVGLGQNICVGKCFAAGIKVIEFPEIDTADCLTNLTASSMVEVGRAAA